MPPGFAHGFVVLSDSADVFYKCTREYAPEDDRGIIWNDPDLGIAWPVKDPVLSEKDSSHPLLKDADNNFEYHEADSKRFQGLKFSLRCHLKSLNGGSFRQKKDSRTCA